MLNKFECGAIVDLTAMEDIVSPGIYVVDKKTEKIRNVYDVNEYVTHQVVLVSNLYSGPIIAGEECRCWYVHLII